MPYKNPEQRVAMHINAPEVAKRWDKRYGKKPLILGRDQRARSARQAAAIRARQENLSA